MIDAHVQCASDVPSANSEKVIAACCCCMLSLHVVAACCCYMCLCTVACTGDDNFVCSQWGVFIQFAVLFTSPWLEVHIHGLHKPNCSWIPSCQSSRVYQMNLFPCIFSLHLGECTSLSFLLLHREGCSIKIMQLALLFLWVLLHNHLGWHLSLHVSSKVWCSTLICIMAAALFSPPSSPLLVRNI